MGLIWVDEVYMVDGVHFYTLNGRNYPFFEPKINPINHINLINPHKPSPLS